MLDGGTETERKVLKVDININLIKKQSKNVTQVVSNYHGNLFTLVKRRERNERSCDDCLIKLAVKSA